MYPKMITRINYLCLVSLLMFSTACDAWRYSSETNKYYRVGLVISVGKSIVVQLKQNHKNYFVICKQADDSLTAAKHLQSLSKLKKIKATLIRVSDASLYHLSSHWSTVNGKILVTLSTGKDILIKPPFYSADELCGVLPRDTKHTR
jgi:hypothetical protein